MPEPKTQHRSPYWWETRIVMLSRKGVSREICSAILSTEDESLLLSLLYAPRDHIQRLNELDSRSRDDVSAGEPAVETMTAEESARVEASMSHPTDPALCVCGHEGLATGWHSNTCPAHNESARMSAGEPEENA